MSQREQLSYAMGISNSQSFSRQKVTSTALRWKTGSVTVLDPRA